MAYVSDALDRFLSSAKCGSRRGIPAGRGLSGKFAEEKKTLNYIELNALLWDIQLNQKEIVFDNWSEA